MTVLTNTFKPELAPEEFVAEDNLNYDKNMSVDEGVESDDETVKTSTGSLPLRHPRGWRWLSGQTLPAETSGRRMLVLDEVSTRGGDCPRDGALASRSCAGGDTGACAGQSGHIQSRRTQIVGVASGGESRQVIQEKWGSSRGVWTCPKGKIQASSHQSFRKNARRHGHGGRRHAGYDESMFRCTSPHPSDRPQGFSGRSARVGTNVDMG